MSPKYILDPTRPVTYSVLMQQRGDRRPATSAKPQSGRSFSFSSCSLLACSFFFSSSPRNTPRHCRRRRRRRRSLTQAMGSLLLLLLRSHHGLVGLTQTVAWWRSPAQTTGNGKNDGGGLDGVQGELGGGVD